VIAGAAVLPTAPLLVPGVTAARPPGLDRVAAAARAVVAALPAHDVTVLLTAARAGEPPGVHGEGPATLAGIGRPDLTTTAPAAPALAASLARSLGLPLHPAGPLPLPAAVLTHLLQPPRPPIAAGPGPGPRPGREGGAAVVAVVVPAAAEGGDLVGLGRALAGALDGVPAVLVAAGDLAAGLTERAPLALVEGAADWNDRVVDEVAAGRLDLLPRLGPQEAARVGALGWAPLVVLHGATAAARLGMVVRTAAAPRGVGYLVASGA